jgi:hypothetical protein
MCTNEKLNRASSEMYTVSNQNNSYATGILIGYVVWNTIKTG